MASEEPDPKPSSRDESVDSSSDSDTSSDENENENVTSRVEWLATGREKRATAGNRMKTMLAHEEPDSDLELLFAEDEDDAGFEEDAGDDSDVQMDSSSDDEDEQNAGGGDDDMEGEKELERQAREKKLAARKRKAQEAIPARFRKKVRINTGKTTTTTTTRTTTPTPAAAATAVAPRPKKKSERTSWLPSPADAPTRASQRQTTRLSKEQLHQQMMEREARRLKQLATMERKQKELERSRKPPKTQAERLAEAALVERRNATSLNRWEEAEKQREEDRRAKLAALNNRTLKGPVITFWSGRGTGEHITAAVEEKPKKKRMTAAEKEREKAAKAKEKELEKEKGKEGSPKEMHGEGQIATSPGEPNPNAPGPQTEMVSGADPVAGAEPNTTGTSPTETKEQPSAGESPAKPVVSTPTVPSPLVSPSAEKPAVATPSPPLPISTFNEPRLVPIDDPTPKAVMTPPALAPPSEMHPPPSVLAAPIMAPPEGITSPGLASPPGYHAAAKAKSNVLAPPNTTQRPSPLSLPPSTPGETPSPPSAAARQQRPSSSAGAKSEQVVTPQAGTGREDLQAASAEKRPPPEVTARNTIILQNFDENVIKDKTIQTQLLFGRKMSKLPKPSPQPLCAITNQPARYRDPKTGLPYHNAYAYKEIQKLLRGEYRWSALLGCWVGAGTEAACGVPARFLDPDAPPEFADVVPEKENEKEVAAAEALDAGKVDEPVEKQSATVGIPDASKEMGTAMEGVEMTSEARKPVTGVEPAPVEGAPTVQGGVPAAGDGKDAGPPATTTAV